MNYQLVVRPEAENDLREAFLWYEDKRRGWDTTFCCTLMQESDSFYEILIFTDLNTRVLKNTW